MKKTNTPMKLSTNEKNKLSGNRLKECMDLREKKATELSRWIEDKGFICSDKYISLIKNGKRPISPSNAYLFAECLKIDSGYLLGKDDFRAESYQDYLEKEESNRQVKKVAQQMSKYDYLLEPYGYYVRSCLADGPDGTNTTTYQIQHNDQMAHIPDKEMKKFKKDVDDFIRLKMDALMDKYEFDLESLRRKAEEAIANGNVTIVSPDEK